MPCPRPYWHSSGRWSVSDLAFVDIARQHLQTSNQRNITVPDLRPRTFPRHSATGLYRSAEEIVFDACRLLPEHWHALHGVHWVSNESVGSIEGECDFVIIGPEIGLIVVEVKGGGVGRDREGWFSIDKARNRHRIKSPVVQAQKGRYALLGYLRSIGCIRQLETMPSTHMVCFPQIRSSELPPLLELPPNLVIDSEDLARLADKLLEGVRFFHNRLSDERPSIAACKTIADALMPSFETVGRWASHIWEQQFAIDKLTADQQLTIDALEINQKISLSGPAGSGKTVAGLRYAKRSIEDGRSVLVIVPSRPLRSYYESVLGRGTATVALVEQTPEHLSATRPHHWERIVVDEAQDVGDALLQELHRYSDLHKSAVLFIHDSNQRLKQGALDPGYGCVRVQFRRVLRNTHEIGELSTRFYLNITRPDVVGPTGAPIDEITVVGEDEIPKAVAAYIAKLVEDEGFVFRDIAVLFGRSSGKIIRAGGQSFSGIKYRDAGKVWAEGCDDSRCVACSSILAFRGMESQVVILCEIDDLLDGELIEACYVGTSRARFRLAVAGLPGTLERIRGVDLGSIAGARQKKLTRHVEGRRGTEKLSKRLSPGSLCLGKVTAVQHYGVFVSLGVGNTGLMHRKYICRDRTLDLEAIFRPGQEITVRIREIDELKGRIDLELPESGLSALLSFRRGAKDNR